MQSTICEIKPRFGHAGHLLYRAFDARNARTAGNSIDRQLHAQCPITGGRGIQREVSISLIAAHANP
jgi:hypothetical protein